MKFNKLKFNSMISIVAGVVVAIIVVVLSLSFFSDDSKKDDKDKQKETITYIIEQDNVSIEDGNVDYLSNERCNSSSIKKRFSLKLDNGSILVTNFDTMENFLINKINNVSTMLEFNYQKACDTSMYAILTTDGQVFYTSDDITKTTDIKKIENKFTLLKSDLRFDQLVLGKENDVINLYGRTSSGNLYKIDLR